MRALLLTASVVAGSVPSVALAEEPAKEKHPKHGGLGYAQVGVLAGPIGDVGERAVGRDGARSRRPVAGVRLHRRRGRSAAAVPPPRDRRQGLRPVRPPRRRTPWPREDRRRGRRARARLRGGQSPQGAVLPLLRCRRLRPRPRAAKYLARSDRLRGTRPRSSRARPGTTTPASSTSRWAQVCIACCSLAMVASRSASTSAALFSVAPSELDRRRRTGRGPRRTAPVRRLPAADRRGRRLLLPLTRLEARL